jgi:hypothetical protein
MWNGGLAEMWPRPHWVPVRLVVGNADHVSRHKFGQNGLTTTVTVAVSIVTKTGKTFNNYSVLTDLVVN